MSLYVADVGIVKIKPEYECDYKNRYKELTLEELMYIRENTVFSGMLSFLFAMVEGRD